MNKTDVVNALAEVLSTKKEAQVVLDSLLTTITDALKEGEDVSLVGFGTFKVVKREARKGRNPQTGEEMQIAEKNVPKFVPGKALKEAVK